MLEASAAASQGGTSPPARRANVFYGRHGPEL